MSLKQNRTHCKSTRRPARSDNGLQNKARLLLADINAFHFWTLVRRYAIVLRGNPRAYRRHPPSLLVLAKRVVSTSASSMQSAAAATAQYQLSLPFALSSVSPGLAALHACRARVAYPADPTLSTSHCSHCGVLFHAGGGTVRLVRARTPIGGSSNGRDGDSPARVLRRSCGLCGHVQDVRVERGNESLFPQPRQRIRDTKLTTSTLPDRPKAAAPLTKPDLNMRSQNQPGSHTRLAPSPSTLPAISPSSHKPTASASSSRSSTPAANRDVRSKSRPKKKSGLQDMLARNRQKQEQEQGKKADAHGLSAFLQDLT